MEFRILGPIEAEDQGLALDLGGMRERTLLARLLLSANRVVSADRIAEDLWSGDPPPHSMATLRVYVSRLRRALGLHATALLTQAPGYRLNVDGEQLDAARFTRLAQTGETALAAGQPEAAAAVFREALELWRGPALSDVAELPFAQADAGRLEEARLAALENRVEADLACGRHASLVAELDGLTAAHPLRERLTGQRVLALYRCGRQAEALRVYGELRGRLAEELGIDPSPELRRLHERLLRQDPALDPAPSPPPPATPAAPAPEPAAVAPPSPPARRPEGPWLPTETTTFVGREAELETIGELLRLSRLITLTGPGGSGKSRLALRVGTQTAGDWPDGVWLAELAPVGQPELVVPTVALALAVREEPGRALPDSIAARLRDSEALLIVDNCEHVIDAAAGLIETLLRLCPRLRILATSQTRLGVPGEASWPVPPLTVPPPGERDRSAAAGTEAVRLFCDRAALARPGFVLTAENTGPVSEICRQLDGIPLAIELAAARVSALTTAQLATRLDNRFRLLTGGSRAGLPRHRTLQAAIEWSHDLLSEAERVCLRRMAVFAGGCTIDAVEAVCPDGALPLEAVFETVTTLVDRSLLTTEERFGSMRYGMLESIHQYALAKLAAAGEEAALRQRHLAWLASYAGQADLAGPDQAAWLDLLEAEQDNTTAALEWGTAAAGHDSAATLALAGALAPFWVVRGPVAVGRSLLEAALANAGPGADPRLRAAALDGVGQLASVQADQDAQRACQQESLAIWRELGDSTRIASCLGDLGAVAHIRGEYPAARELYAEALELAERAGDAQQMGMALSGLGRLALHQDELEQALGYYTASMARFREVGDLRRATLILGNLGVVATNLGDLALAEQRLAEHLDNARRLGDRKLTGGALTNLGQVAYYLGDLDRSAALHTEAVELGELLGDRRLTAAALINLGLVAAAREDFTAARTFLLRSLALADAVGERRSVAEIFEELALVAASAGEPERAATLLGAAHALRQLIGAPAPASDLDRHEAARVRAAAALGREAFDTAVAAGAELSLPAAVAFARGENAGVSPTRPGVTAAKRALQEGSNALATALQSARPTIEPIHPVLREARHEGTQPAQP